MLERPSLRPVFTTGQTRSSAQEAYYQQTLVPYTKNLEILRSGRYIDYPSLICIESLALCNASCTFCAYPGMERKGERMPDELLWRLFDELVERYPKDLPLALCLSRLNEPLLDVRTYEFVRRMHAELPQASLWVYTNASTLTEANADRLREWTRVPLFNISFNDHRPEHYARTMALDFERTVSNIDRLHAMHDADELTFDPQLSRVGDASDTDDEFVAWCNERWPRFGTLVWEEYDYTSESPWYDPRAVPDVGCHQWFHLSVIASGDVVFCCADCEGTHPVDNVRDKGLLDAYNAPDRRALRTGLPSRKAVDPCVACTRL